MAPVQVSSGTRDRVWMPGALLVLAAVGWWWSARMASQMSGGMTMADPVTSVSAAGFLVAWVAMMGAMMFPAIIPVVRLYGRAAVRGTVAPVPFFVGGYLLVWTALGVPAYLVWHALAGPISDGAPWAARLAGAVFVVAALYQVTPLKTACLRKCRSPLSFFMRHTGRLDRPQGAVRAGATHGLICVGCCWALMAVLVALGTMQLAWMLGLAGLIFLEKVTRFGERVALAAAPVFLAIGTVLVVFPHTLTYLV
jgi:predicted metal-binding membrane protein